MAENDVSYFRGAWSSGVAAGTTADPLMVTGAYRQREQVTHNNINYVYISAQDGNTAEPGADSGLIWEAIGPTTAQAGATNLAVANRDSDSLEITSDTGTDATIDAATNVQAGLMTSTQFSKLDGIATGADVTADNIPATVIQDSDFGLTGEQISSINIGGTARTIVGQSANALTIATAANSFVRHDEATMLSEENKARARDNINATSIRFGEHSFQNVRVQTLGGSTVLFFDRRQEAVDFFNDIKATSVPDIDGTTTVSSVNAENGIRLHQLSISGNALSGQYTFPETGNAGSINYNPNNNSVSILAVTNAIPDTTGLPLQVFRVVGGQLIIRNNLTLSEAVGDGDDGAYILDVDLPDQVTLRELVGDDDGIVLQTVAGYTQSTVADTIDHFAQQDEFRWSFQINDASLANFPAVGEQVWFSNQSSTTLAGNTFIRGQVVRREDIGSDVNFIEIYVGHEADRTAITGTNSASQPALFYYAFANTETREHVVTYTNGVGGLRLTSELGGGSGHDIQGPAGTDLATRSNLQFLAGFQVYDDSSNDRTIIRSSVTGGFGTWTYQETLASLADGEIHYDSTTNVVTVRGTSPEGLPAAFAEPGDQIQLFDSTGSTGLVQGVVSRETIDSTTVAYTVQAATELTGFATGDSVAVAITLARGKRIQDPDGNLQPTDRRTLQFVGDGVTVTDDSTNEKTIVTITGDGGSGGTYPTTGGFALEAVGSGSHPAGSDISWPTTAASAYQGFGEVTGITILPPTVGNVDTTGSATLDSTQAAAGALRLRNDTGSTIDLGTGYLEVVLVYNSLPADGDTNPRVDVRSASGSTIYTGFADPALSTGTNVYIDASISSDNFSWTNGTELYVYVVETTDADQGFTYTIESLSISYGNRPFRRQTGTFNSIFGLDEATATGGQAIVRNAGDTAWEFGSVSGSVQTSGGGTQDAGPTQSISYDDSFVRGYNGTTDAATLQVKSGFMRQSLGQFTGVQVTANDSISFPNNDQAAAFVNLIGGSSGVVYAEHQIQHSDSGIICRIPPGVLASASNTDVNLTFPQSVTATLITSSAGIAIDVFVLVDEIVPGAGMLPIGYAGNNNTDNATLTIAADGSVIGEAIDGYVRAQQANLHIDATSTLGTSLYPVVTQATGGFRNYNAGSSSRPDFHDGTFQDSRRSVSFAVSVPTGQPAPQYGHEAYLVNDASSPLHGTIRNIFRNGSNYTLTMFMTQEGYDAFLNNIVNDTASLSVYQVNESTNLQFVAAPNGDAAAQFTAITNFIDALTNDGVLTSAGSNAWTVATNRAIELSDGLGHTATVNAGTVVTRENTTVTFATTGIPAFTQGMGEDPLTLTVRYGAADLVEYSDIAYFNYGDLTGNTPFTGLYFIASVTEDSYTQSITNARGETVESTYINLPTSQFENSTQGQYLGVNVDTSVTPNVRTWRMFNPGGGAQIISAYLNSNASIAPLAPTQDPTGFNLASGPVTPAVTSPDEPNFDALATLPANARQTFASRVTVTTGTVGDGQWFVSTSSSTSTTAGTVVTEARAGTIAADGDWSSVQSIGLDVPGTDQAAYDAIAANSRIVIAQSGTTNTNRNTNSWAIFEAQRSVVNTGTDQYITPLMTLINSNGTVPNGAVEIYSTQGQAITGNAFDNESTPEYTWSFNEPSHQDGFTKYITQTLYDGTSYGTWTTPSVSVPSDNGIYVLRDQTAASAVIANDGVTVLNVSGGDLMISNGAVNMRDDAGATNFQLRFTANSGATNRMELRTIGNTGSSSPTRSLAQRTIFGPLQYAVSDTQPGPGSTSWMNALDDDGMQIYLWKRQITHNDEFWNMSRSAPGSVTISNADSSDLIDAANQVDTFTAAINGGTAYTSGTADLPANTWLRLRATVSLPDNNTAVRDETNNNWRIISTTATTLS